jgi:hypothetical protein
MCQDFAGPAMWRHQHLACEKRLPPWKERFVKILLVVPRFTCSPAEGYMLPAGLAYIASALKKAGKEVYGLNLNHFEKYHI